MASGKAHAIATTLMSGVSVPALIFLARFPLGDALAFGAGCLAGLVIGPDQDVRHPTHADRVVRQTLGGIAAFLWHLIWYPYARLIPYHRHIASHFPVVGTALRVLYFGAILALLYFVLSLLLPIPKISPELAGLVITHPWLWWGLGGLVAADSLHTIMDLF